MLNSYIVCYFAKGGGGGGEEIIENVTSYLHVQHLFLQYCVNLLWAFPTQATLSGFSPPSVSELITVYSMLK